jgi:hypothetical protein
MAKFLERKKTLLDASSPKSCFFFQGLTLTISQGVMTYMQVCEPETQLKTLLCKKGTLRALCPSPYYCIPEILLINRENPQKIKVWKIIGELIKQR